MTQGLGNHPGNTTTGNRAPAGAPYSGPAPEHRCNGIPKYGGLANGLVRRMPCGAIEMEPEPA